MRGYKPLTFKRLKVNNDYKIEITKYNLPSYLINVITPLS